MSAGAWPITLGRLVLRSETAAIYCLSCWATSCSAATPERGGLHEHLEGPSQVFRMCQGFELSQLGLGPMWRRISGLPDLFRDSR